MTRHSHAAAHRQRTQAQWEETKLTWWWRRQRVLDWRRDPNRLKDDAASFVARKLLPKRVRYYAAIDVAVHATTGPYSSQIVPELRVTEMLDRYCSELRVPG